jgi:hypothetical protein
MAVEDEIVDAIVKALEAKAQHVANIVVGPKREEWFNAECFVAVSHRQTLEASSYIVYGKQAYKEALAETPLAVVLDAADGAKIPDLVGYSTAAGRDDYDVVFVLEAKVFYRHEDPAARATALRKLREQLDRAKRACPTAAAIGVLYLVAIAGKGGVVPEPFLTMMKAETLTAFDGINIRWLREPALLAGLRLHGTSFPSYPSAHVSVGVGALLLT